MNTIDLIDTIKNSSSKKEVCLKLGLPDNGRSTNFIKNFINENKIDISHFRIEQANRKRKYKVIKKLCPICGKEFETQKGIKKEKSTCSSSCANSFFRSGENNPNYKRNGGREDLVYRKICFKHHKKECVVCEENVIVEVHHYDGNHDNNEPKNLVPLCPTHHKYWHSKHRLLIKDCVDTYVNKFKMG